MTIPERRRNAKGLGEEGDLDVARRQDVDRKGRMLDRGRSHVYFLQVGDGHRHKCDRSHSFLLGGQTPLSRAVRKKGFHNPSRVIWTVLNLRDLSQSIEAGRIRTDEIITMKTLRDTGVVGKKIKHGIKVLGEGASEFKHRVHLQVSKCSIKAEKAIEENGGTVRFAYYDKEGLKALLKPKVYLRKGWMLPDAPQHIPAKRAAAYDFVGKVLPETRLGASQEHFQPPKRKQEGHPALPAGRGHIKNRYKSRILIDYGKKRKEKEVQEVTN